MAPLQAPQEPAASAGGDGEARRLLQQLQMHQIELEVQNEELQRARRETEAALALYAELYEEAPVGYLGVDARGRILRSNRAGSRLLGLELEAAIGRPLAGFVEHLDRPALQALIERVAADGSADGEFALQPADGGALRIVHLRARADTDGARITLADVSEQRLASAALVRSEARLRNAYRRLAQAQEGERLRLTEQLHDQVGRNLTALGLNLSILQQELGAQAPPPVLGRLRESASLLQDAVAQMRGLMSELYPPMLGDYGLYAALRWWCGEMRRRGDADVVLADGDPHLRLRGETETALFRIAQEALENALRHAAARCIEVQLRCDDTALQMAIVDDGHGFDVVAMLADDGRASWGLTWMRERAAAVGARLRLESAHGTGTRVVVELPRREW